MQKTEQKICKCCKKEFTALYSETKRGNGIYCSQQCSARFRFTKDPEKHFKQNYIPEPNTGCWLWIGSMEGRYPLLSIKGKRKRAHAYSLEQKLGRSLMPGMCVLHKCDTPHCVNPNHLFEGTQQENIKDCQKKGRMQNRSLDKARSTKYRGVYLHGRDKKYFPVAYKDGKKQYGGYYNNPEDAAKAYDKIALELYGKEAKLNFWPANPALADPNQPPE